MDRRRKDIDSIPGGGPIVDEFFSNVPDLNFNMCMNTIMNISPLSIAHCTANSIKLVFPKG